MQHTATRAIGVRLNLWKTFFEMGRDGTPPGVSDGEYDYDHLIDLARDTGISELRDLADVVELMAHNYLRRMNQLEADMLMLDDTPPGLALNDDQRDAIFAGRTTLAALIANAAKAPTSGHQKATRIKVTMAELDAALAG